MKSKTYIWFPSLVVSILVIYLAVRISFAQSRPSKPAGTIKTKLGSFAVIEHPAFATMTLKG